MLITDASVLLSYPVLSVHSSCPLHTPLLVSQWKAKEAEAGLLANLIVSTNYAATVNPHRKQLKVAA